MPAYIKRGSLLEFNQLCWPLADLKGDVLNAQGKADEARAAYQLALTKTDAQSKYRILIQMKLDALGGAK